jgi:hypothetical protein
MLKIIDGNLLNATEDYICHQCNCKGVAGGLAATMFEEHPYAAPTGGVEGTVQIHHPDNGPAIVNMFAQSNPGPPSKPGDGDSAASRLYWFKLCLNQMFRADADASYAFPYKVGCGIGGGDWGSYIDVIRRFETFIKGDVTLYHLNGY